MEDPETQNALRHARGGLYFEDMEVGKLYEHRYTRTVTQMDNMLFSNMTLNPQPLHIDRHFCETETEWGQPLMNSLFTLGLMIGISVQDTTLGTTIANLGMTETVLRSDIQAIRASRVSLMPEGLEAAVPVPEMADLLAFLRSKRERGVGG